MTLTQYRKKFPNLDFDRLTAAVEFALDAKDHKRVIRQIAARVARQYVRHTAPHVLPGMVREVRNAIDILRR